MAQRGKHTLYEINSQPETWAAVLAQVQENAGEIKRLFEEGNYRQILFTGCGSTYYVSIAAAAVFQKLLRLPSRGLPASEIWLSDDSSFIFDGRTLLVAISRSGETTETINACKKFKSEGLGDVLTLSCYPDKPIANCGTMNVVFPTAQENSIAQTRAFSSLYLAAMAIAVYVKDDGELLSQLPKLPDYGSEVIWQNEQLVDQIASNEKIDTIFYLGSGSRYGLACELSLKMKEISLSVSEPFHFLEFRHGPMSMVTDRTLIVGLVSESYQAQELAVLDEMKQRGASVLSIGNNGTDVHFGTSIPEILQGPLFLPVGQLLAVNRALRFQHNPDKPKNLNAVVKLNAENT